MIKSMPYFLALLAFLVGMAFLMGMFLQAENQRDRDAQESIDTHQDINDADVSTGDPDADRNWLRDFLGSD